MSLHFDFGAHISAPSRRTGIPIYSITLSRRPRSRLPNSVLQIAENLALPIYQNLLGRIHQPADPSHRVQVQFIPQTANHQEFWTRLLPIDELPAAIQHLMDNYLEFSKTEDEDEYGYSRDFFNRYHARFYVHIPPHAGIQWHTPPEFSTRAAENRMILFNTTSPICVPLALLTSVRRHICLDTREVQIQNEWTMARALNCQQELNTEAWAWKNRIGETPFQFTSLFDGLHLYANDTHMIIHVLSREQGENEMLRVIPNGLTTAQLKTLFHTYIYYSEDHVYGITKPHLIIGESGSRGHLMCDWCLKTFRDGTRFWPHVQKCFNCQSYDCRTPEQLKRALALSAYPAQFYHIKPAEEAYVCVTCRLFLKQSDIDNIFEEMSVAHEDHDVTRGMTVRCRHCQAYWVDTATSEHQCYMRKPTMLKQGSFEQYWFWDVETMCSPTSENKEEHSINCIVLQHASGLQTFQFDSLDEFCRYILDDDDFENTIFIAHNGGRFDMHFLLRWLIENEYNPEFMPDGEGGIHHLLHLKINNRTFIDSYNFISLPLRDFANTFGLESDKGHFPHSFNTPERQSYSGPLPPCMFYGQDESLHGHELEQTELLSTAFREWYEEEKNKYNEQHPWVLREQLIFYCTQDVNVLRQGCLQFRQLFLDMETMTLDPSQWTPHGIDPFQYMTLAQATLQFFLYGLPEEKSIAHFPNIIDPWHHKDAQIYMNWLCASQYPQLKINYECPHTHTTLHGYLEGQEIVFMYIDCDLMGCPVLHEDPEEYNPFMKTLCVTQWIEVVKRIHLLQKWYKVHIFHSHTLAESQKQNQQFANYWRKHETIKPREGLFGGRVELIQPYVCATGEEKIDYVDVRSLYPTVCAYDELPIGHPIQLTGSQLNMDALYRQEYFGVIKCTVLPPANLYIPVLPYVREDGRLVFDNEMKTGTWTSAELYFAIEFFGYSVVELIEVQHYPQERRCQGLFYDYVQLLLEIKNKAEQNNNPGLRYLAKLCLNGIWGKIGQRPYDLFLALVTSLKQYYDYTHSPNLDKNESRWLELTNNAWLFRSRINPLYARNASHYHPHLAAFVTSHARNRLHTEMLKIGLDRIIYCDTDSIIYLWEKEKYNVTTGPDLGDWVHEFKGWPNEWATEFIGLGPKTYCLVLNNGRGIYKAKGVSLSLENMRTLSPTKLKRLLVETIQRINPEPLSMKNFHINVQYDNGGSTVVSCRNTKILQATITKRKLPKPFVRLDNKKIIRITTAPFNSTLQAEIIFSPTEEETWEKK